MVRVSGATTGCGVTREGLAAAAVVIEPALGIAMSNRLWIVNVKLKVEARKF